MECLQKFHKHSQDWEAESTTTTDNESEGEQSCTDSDTEVDNDDTVAVILDTAMVTPLSAAPEVVKDSYSTRDYTTAVLSAFDALSQTSEDKHKKLLIAELGDLKPVAYIDHQANEQNLLAHSNVIDKNHSGEDIETNMSPTIRNVLLNSPYKKLLSKANYIELDHQCSLYLNNNWSLNPIATHIASKILEEMILVEAHKALLVLCGEIYGRLPTLDAHHERTSITKGNLPQSSLPHADTKYPNVELCLMNVDNSQKLVLGTKTMNVLITSSIRIDCNEKPVVGPSSSNGFLPSRNSRIYVEKKKLDEIERMIEKKATLNEISTRQVLLYPFDEFSQLRQIRSKFDKLSTYLCYRFSSKYTNDCRSRPLTIWILTC
ncbi:uncharacterized protein EV154DRAFT_559636 [Mucor mucedo]|uniref:uncharacterized protein n=1 Tax=Mucor mucedo TaxID=29922 RepID=UPI00221FB05D|nr:uncharacterized protein EV154DRAFT_559636 [Mucor mucedo]KAI7895220.1 hypothetical protein EV154DRAFT_559636 [Mucor mucedo]